MSPPVDGVYDAVLSAVRSARDVEEVLDVLAEALGGLEGSGPVRRWTVGASPAMRTDGLPRVAAEALLERGGAVVRGGELAVAVPVEDGATTVLVARLHDPSAVPVRRAQALASIAAMAAARLADLGRRDAQAREVTALHQVLENVAAATTPRMVAAAILSVVVTAYGWDGGIVVRQGAPGEAERLEVEDPGEGPVVLARRLQEPHDAALLTIGAGAHGPRGRVIDEVLPGGLVHALVWPLYAPSDVRLVVHGRHPLGIDKGLGATLGPIAQAASAARAGLDRLDQAARQRRAAEAERANAAKSEFLSRMSHELRTPLNAVIGFAELLELEDLDADATDSLRQIRRAGRHLLDLVNEALDIARIEAGRLTVSVESLDISTVVGECVDLVWPIARTAGITVEVDVTGCEGCRVAADLQRTKQVLINLLTNACNYNRQGGRVEVTLRAAEDGVVIAVTDTGMGIAAERLEEVFTPFERLGADAGEVQGTGLGLALSRRLAEAMGGTLEVQSTVAVGSTFTLTLPTSADQPALVLPPTEVASGLAADGGPAGTVLYIEDNRSNVTLARHILRRRPSVSLHDADSGHAGVASARALHPDLVLLDLDLPDIDGQAVLRLLQADPATAGIPVVVVSADATPHRIAALRGAGAQGYLTKPFDIAVFLHTVDHVLAPTTAPATAAPAEGTAVDA